MMEIMMRFEFQAGCHGYLFVATNKKITKCYFFLFAQCILAAIVVFNVSPFLQNFRDIPMLWRQDKYHFISAKKSHLGFGMCLKGRNGCFTRAGQSSGHSLGKGVLRNMSWRNVYCCLFKSICNSFYRGKNYSCFFPDPLRRQLPRCQTESPARVSSCAGFLIRTLNMMWVFLTAEALIKCLEIWTGICDPCLQLLPGLGWSRCANKAFHGLPFPGLYIVCNL